MADVINRRWILKAKPARLRVTLPGIPLTGLDALFGIAVKPEMPRKVRPLITDLERAGFVDRGGKGSHRNYVHPKGPRVTVSGKPGDDAHYYQEQQVHQRIEESHK
jgi:predicted RNA binding protein YcfA (HicA-like mRNA interferase family)